MHTINPDNKEHSRLELDVSNFLESNGFYVTSATYHDVFDSHIAKRLAEIYTPTGLYVRGRADRLAIHKYKNIVFEWEAKTHTSARLHDMTIEALPLCHHIAKSRLGVECIYIYRDSYIDLERAFAVTNLPAIREVLIPNRWSIDKIEWFESMFNIFIESRTRRINSSRGSGDPFAIISKKTVQLLPGWKDLIVNILKGV